MDEPVPLNQGRLPSLDGWRGVSIAFVLASHMVYTRGFPPGLTLPFRWLFDGLLAVRCFFEISGLLITWLLLKEHSRRGSINLKHFYLRRAIRILPVYWAFLAVLAVLSVFTPFRQSWPTWARNLTFTTNFVAGTWTTAHLWSIAIEEQFYLLWPFILLLLLRAKNRKLVGAVTLSMVFMTAAASRTIGYVMHQETDITPLLSSFSFFNYWDSVAVGCLLAFVITRRPQWLALIRVHPISWASVAASLILFPYVLERLYLLGIITVPLGPILESLGLGMFILQSITHPGLFFYRLLNTPPLKAVGVLSYSIYIWQQIFCTQASSFGFSPAWWPGFPIWVIPSLLMGYLSYHWFEAPLLRLRGKFRDVTHGDEQLPITRAV